jgi:hypothetical protein
VTELVSKNFVAARFHVKDQADAFKRFDALWTPTILILDPTGKEQHRIEGFLPVEDFLAQLQLGLGHTAFKTGKFAEAEKWFREVVEKFPKTEAAAEAQYWAGVARYKGANDASALKATAEAFKKRYSDTSWAKKASIWA